MIVRSAFRGAGGLTRHLMRVDTNERVIFRDDLSTWPVIDRSGLSDAIDAFHAIGNVRGTTKTLIHIAVSPSEALSMGDLNILLGHVRNVYGIAVDHPMVAIEHRKPGETNRPSHFHFVLQRAVEGGSLISDKMSRRKNERLSLEVAHDLGHVLVAGPHLESCRARLAAERPDMISALTALRLPARAQSTTALEKLIASDIGIDLATIDRKVFDAFHQGAQHALERRGFLLATGDKGVMVVHAPSGFAQSLNRVLNRESKRRGANQKYRAAEIKRRFAHAPPLDAVRAAGLTKASRQAQSAHAAAAKQYNRSAPIDFERAVAAPSAPAPAAKRKTIKAQVQQIRANHAAAHALRLQLLLSARRRRRFWRRHGKLIARAAGALTLFGGGGVPLALCVLIALRGAAVWRARQEAIEAERARAATPRSLKEELDSYFDKLREANRFNLNSIPKQARIAAGALFSDFEAGRAPDAHAMQKLDQLSPGLPRRIMNVAHYSSNARTIAVFKRMFVSGAPAHERALAKFLAASPKAKRSPDAGRGVGD